MKILAVVPARGGSKGIPRKNLREIDGKPLLVHTIEAAQATNAITRIIVSTDDDEIAQISGSHGAEVVQRPANISGDGASSESALLHVLDTLRDAEGYVPDLVVFLQATSPLRHNNDIQNALETFWREQADSLFSACVENGFIWRKQGSQLTSFTYDYRNRQRRQDAPLDLLENGSIYIFKPWVLRQNNNRLGGKIGVYIMSTLNSFQVDELDDLVLIEKLMVLRGQLRA